MRLTFSIILFFSALISIGQNEFEYHFNKGVDKYDVGKYSEAITDFSNALKNRNSASNDYRIVNALKSRALCRMHLKSFSSAISDIEEALKIKPEFSELYYTRSLIHLRSKEYDNCIEWANKGLAIKPEFEELILLKVKAKVFSKKYAEALPFIDTVLAINPKNVEAISYLGYAQREMKNFKGCVDAYTKIIEIDPQNPLAFYDRGICRAYEKDFDGALADINRGMEVDTSERAGGLNNIAFFIKFEQKDYEAAIKLFDEAIRLKPDFAYAYNNRGYAKMQLGDLKGARQDISKSLQMDPTNSYAYKTFAQLLIAEKKPAQACEQLKRALKLGYKEDYDDEVDELLKLHCNN